MSPNTQAVLEPRYMVRTLLALAVFAFMLSADQPQRPPTHAEVLYAIQQLHAGGMISDETAKEALQMQPMQ